MSDFSALLNAAHSSPRPTQDVQVLLDAGVSEKRELLEARLERAESAPADDRLSSVSAKEQTVKKVQDELAKLTAEAADSLITLRFTRMPGDKWAEITARCPARPDAPIDTHYGYNMHAVCRLAAPLSGVRVEGDKEFPLLVTPATEDSPRVDEWATLFDTISGHEFGQIIETIYTLNEFTPAMNVNALKKELATRPA